MLDILSKIVEEAVKQWMFLPLFVFAATAGVFAYLANPPLLNEDGLRELMPPKDDGFEDDEAHSPVGNAQRSRGAISKKAILNSYHEKIARLIDELGVQVLAVTEKDRQNDPKPAVGIVAWRSDIEKAIRMECVVIKLSGEVGSVDASRVNGRQVLVVCEHIGNEHHIKNGVEALKNAGATPVGAVAIFSVEAAARSKIESDLGIRVETIVEMPWNDIVAREAASA